ncbi:hypothetical protein ACFWDQ_38080 [Streptomyces sp. NPDC060053]|uniref:hypothetical protein n=1 Tax=Streptomyces sp. NPDC060053 TaxID=3347047 RepID=UPI0036B32A4E
MSIRALPPIPSRFATAPTVPRWAQRAAAATLWVSLPSALWRLAVALGVPLGLAESEYDSMLIPGGWAPNAGSWSARSSVCLVPPHADPLRDPLGDPRRHP